MRLAFYAAAPPPFPINFKNKNNFRINFNNDSNEAIASSSDNGYYHRKSTTDDSSLDENIYSDSDISIQHRNSHIISSNDITLINNIN